jgi:hypothetical protein
MRAKLSTVDPQHVGGVRAIFQDSSEAGRASNDSMSQGELPLIIFKVKPSHKTVDMARTGYRSAETRDAIASSL